MTGEACGYVVLFRCIPEALMTHRDFNLKSRVTASVSKENCRRRTAEDNTCEEMIVAAKGSTTDMSICWRYDDGAVRKIFQLGYSVDHFSAMTWFQWNLERGKERLGNGPGTAFATVVTAQISVVGTVYGLKVRLMSMKRWENALLRGFGYKNELKQSKKIKT